MATKRPTKAGPARAGKAAAVSAPVSPNRASVKSSRASTTSASPAAAQDPQVAQIQRLIDMMVEKGAVEVELEGGGTKLRVRLKEDRPTGLVHYTSAPPSTGAAQAPTYGAASPVAPLAGDPADGDVFLSPMVGTFYRSSSPDAEPFVQVGDSVAADGSLCIIEAMKVMNEIKAEFAAQVTAILVENGTPVEFGQPLFRLKRS